MFSLLSGNLCHHSLFIYGTKWSENAADYREKELEESRKVLRGNFSTSLETIQLDIYVTAMIEFKEATCAVRTPIQLWHKLIRSHSETNPSTSVFQSDHLCQVAEKKDAHTLRSNLNSNLANLCHELMLRF